MGIESYGTTNPDNETWSCDGCDEVIDLDHYNDIQAHIWAHENGAIKVRTMTRLQEAMFRVLNDEFDLPQKDFFLLWPTLESVLAAHGMKSTPVKTPRTWENITPREIIDSILEWKRYAQRPTPPVDAMELRHLAPEHTLRDLAAAYLAEVPVISFEPYKEPEYEFGAHLAGWGVHAESVFSTEEDARAWIRRATTRPDKWVACKRIRANNPGEWEDLP